MRYAVIGAGGTGGIVGAAIFKAGQDVTLIARGEHLKQIRSKGLVIRSMQDGSEEVLPVTACTEEAYSGTADVIFLCVKGYSVEGALPFIDRISRPDTLIIPVLNIFTTGELMREKLPGKYVVDGCIYVSANIEEPGVLLQHAKILRIVYGAAAGQEKRPILKTVQEELNSKEFRLVLSDHIRRDALKKFCYVSPIGAAGLYYHATAGDFREEGAKRDLYIGLMREVEALAEKMGQPFDTDVIGQNLNILDHQPPEATTSLQRDVYAGKQSEIRGLILDIPELGEKYGLELPLYRQVAEKCCREILKQ